MEKTKQVGEEMPKEWMSVVLVMLCCTVVTVCEQHPDNSRTAAFAALHSAFRLPVHINICPRIHTVAPPSMQFSVPKDDKKSGGTSVLDKPVVDTSPKADDKLGKDKMYHVLLFNDPVNTREYVCKIIVEVFGHTKSKAYEIMNHAHTSGFAVCITTGKDEADGMSGKLTDANLMSSVVEASGNDN